MRHPGGPQRTIGGVPAPTGVIPASSDPERHLSKLADRGGAHRHSCVSDAKTPGDDCGADPAVSQGRPCAEDQRGCPRCGGGADSICLMVARPCAQRRTRAARRGR